MLKVGHAETVITYGVIIIRWTIKGSKEDPGMIPRAIAAIFQYIEQSPHLDFTIAVSYIGRLSLSLCPSPKSNILSSLSLSPFPPPTSPPLRLPAVVVCWSYCHWGSC